MVRKKVTLGVRSLAFRDLVREGGEVADIRRRRRGSPEVEAGTKTMVAIGPASTEAIDKITGVCDCINQISVVTHC